MRCYTVTTPDAVTYVATQGDCRRLKNDLIASGIPKKQIQVDEVEVPLAKAELISYLNKIVEEAENRGAKGENHE
jgi:hypothetical protein